jgi:type I restriction enzyme S subunit
MNELRFKDATGRDFPEWEVVELEKIALKVNKKNKDLSLNNVLTNSATQGIVSQSDYFERDIANQNNLGGYYVVQTDDFVYNPRISANALVGPIKRNNLNTGVMSPLYTVFRFNEGDLDFFEQYFQTNHWHDYMKSVSNSGARHDRMNITNESFLGLPLPYPSKPEQTKIANFLTVVDEKTTQLTQKCDLLAQYKKGVMQQIFTQELRFEDDGGQDFPEWEDKSLSDVGKSFNGLVGKSGDDFGSGQSYITYKQIFDSSKIDVNKFSFVEIGENEKQNKVTFGDVFFTTSSETPNEVGFCSVLLSEVNDVYLNSFCFGYRINSFEILSPLFAQFLFHSSGFRENVIKLAQGSTRYNISKVSFMETRVQLPCIHEQTKIANFLTAIDDKITATQTQLQAVKQYKQGLLQQMFV